MLRDVANSAIGTKAFLNALLHFFHLMYNLRCAVSRYGFWYLTLTAICILLTEGCWLFTM